MISLTATDARKSFFDLIKKSTQQHQIFEVQHKSGNVVLMSSAEYDSLQESLLLLSQPNFKAEFDESVEQANKGELVSFDNVFGESQ